MTSTFSQSLPLAPRSVPPTLFIALEQLEVLVRIGWGEAEAKIPQVMVFHLKVQFPALPLGPTGLMTEALADTVCYASMAELLRLTAQKTVYRLVEQLAYEVFGELKARLPEGAWLWLKVTKAQPPIAGLKGGASILLVDQGSSFD